MLIYVEHRSEPAPLPPEDPPTRSIALEVEPDTLLDEVAARASSPMSLRFERCTTSLAQVDQSIERSGFATRPAGRRN